MWPLRSAMASFAAVLLLLLAPLVSSLSMDYYAISCPNVESIVRTTMRGLFVRDPTSPAAMLRLIFHDCSVFGCDASILLDSGSDGTAELEAPANLGVRRLDWIDNVKGRLEAACPQTVSCADIIALAAREAVAQNGGPNIDIPLGRLDGFSASSSAAESSLPSATISVSDMFAFFGAMGMSVPESVAILGAHTLGIAHCTNFVDRLYPVRDPNMGLLFANTLKARCPRQFPSNAFAALDTSNFRFDNSYFRNILNGRGLLMIDSEIGLDPRTGPIVENFANSPGAFFDAFASAFVKLSSNNVLSGNQGEVRVNCHFPN
ncbi:hypothetical protein KP509_27G037400 [Ceratopteris richardii]|uniref:Peroxidase n=1 Tax=Ceratopteris richardii TaxID=49495 RepID=A0A8T2RFF5_CERRI|nr:hypothetical protein KP509_27G037400 [Ceratopteris richardii]